MGLLRLLNRLKLLIGSKVDTAINELRPSLTARRKVSKLLKLQFIVLLGYIFKQRRTSQRMEKERGLPKWVFSIVYCGIFIIFIKIFPNTQRRKKILGLLGLYNQKRAKENAAFVCCRNILKDARVSCQLSNNEGPENYLHK